MFENKNVVVLGAGKSGIAVSKIMKELRANVQLIDSNEQLDIPFFGVELKLGEHHSAAITNETDWVIKSPGIPYTNNYVQQAKELGIQVVTEVEIAYLLASAPIISITGSNGKTTTTTLISELLKSGKKQIVTGGNIGEALCEQVYMGKNLEWIVAELSSFQLMGINELKPKIACLVNIYPAHLDYHGSLEAYIEAKMNVFKNQGLDDYAILNEDQVITAQLRKQIVSTVYTFSVNKEVARGAYVYDGYIFFKEGNKKELITDIRSLALKGEHNLENVLTSIIVAKLAKLETKEIVSVLQTFTGVEHRLEFVVEKKGVKFYNDSKATNPEAAIRALAAFDEPIIHICGGLDRGIDFHEFLPFYKKGNIKEVIAYGQSKEKIKQMADKVGVRTVFVQDVEVAVVEAKKSAKNGDIVLLSPACASWDLYKSFEERGNLFKKQVKKQGK